jgi:uncharacterized membrane protein (UPF0127 family)
MKRLLLIFLIGLVVCSLARPPEKDYVQVFFPNGNIITAELAISASERARGLMYREKLNPDQGMLFIFDYADNHAMWMKNMLISLDFLWLDSEKRIVHIEENIPPCEREPCPSYGSKFPAIYVLELKAGSVKENELKLYDLINFVLKDPNQSPG